MSTKKTHHMHNTRAQHGIQETVEFQILYFSLVHSWFGNKHTSRRELPGIHQQREHFYIHLLIPADVLKNKIQKLQLFNN
jgi:hypothetical protein